MNVKASLALLLLAFVAATAGARVKAEWIGGETYDYGIIRESDGPRECEFRFQNQGRKPIRILDVKPGCGCTAVEYTEGKIKKGELGIIKVTFDPEERPGRFDKDIKVYLDGEKEPVTLKILGTVMASAETLQLFYPVGKGTLRFDIDTLDFGAMRRGLRRREFLDLYNCGSQPVKPEIKSNTNALRFEMSREEIEPGETATLTVYLDSAQLMWLGTKELAFSVDWGEGKSRQEQEIGVVVELNAE